MIHLDIEGGILAGEDLSLRIQRVGQEHCDPKKKHEMRKWDMYSSLHFVLYGSGVLYANGKKIMLTKGDAFMLFAGNEYEYYPVSHDPWSYIWVDFRSNNAEAMFAPCGLTPEKPFLHISELPAYIDLLKDLYEAYDAGDVQQLRCSAYFLLILGELVKRTERTRLYKGESSVKHRHVRDIVTYMNNNYRLQLTVQDIATNNHISVGRMMALFSELVGMPPLAYLNRFRISAACEMLKKTRAPIGDIANAVGVEDRLYFSRLFKKYKGVSPREYRASEEQEDPYAWLKEHNVDFR